MSDDNANGEDLLEFLLHNQSIVEPEINHDTQNQKPVPAKENRVPIGGIGTKKGSMAKIGKGQKRPPEIKKDIF